MRPRLEMAADLAIGRILPVNMPSIAVAMKVKRNARVERIGRLPGAQTVARLGEIGMLFFHGKHKHEWRASIRHAELPSGIRRRDSLEKPLGYQLVASVIVVDAVVGQISLTKLD